jgi:tetratricopeptide (TPR) repeat protein
MTTKKRMSRHEMREDQFVTGVFKLEEWAEGNLQKILIGVGAVIIIGLAVWFFISQSGKSEEEAFRKLGSAEVFVRQNQTQLAVADFEEVLNKYASSQAAPQAAFKLANLYFQTNDFAKAEQAYRKYASSFVVDEYFRLSAERGIAGSLAGQARYGEAARGFIDAARSDTTATTYEEDLFDAVDNAVRAGDSGLAKEAFDYLSSKGTTSERYRAAKILLIEKGMLSLEQGDYK